MVTTASVNSVDPNDVIAKSYDDARKVSKIFNEFFEEEADVHAIRTKGQPVSHLLYPTYFYYSLFIILRQDALNFFMIYNLANCS